MSINWQQYPIVAFIDSNIALECSALGELPWKEISATGPILVLVVPTVLQEVDSKKNHARLADHARRFNRTLRPLLEGKATVLVRESPAPRVEIALADCTRVDWEQYPELDQDEPDARVVAQALSVQGPSPESRVVVSQDIRPLHLARRHGLKIHQVSETWLRPKEISEAEKKAANLQRQLNAMKDREPQLSLHLSTSQPSVDVHRIKALSPDERLTIQETIIRLSPMPEQEHSELASIMGDYDHTLDERYAKWARDKVPHFVGDYERKIELNYGQLKIRFRIENTGQVPAESLLIRLTATGGWFNERYVLASPSGPSAPRPKRRSLMDIHISRSLDDSIRSMAQPGKHEFVVLDDPKRSLEVQIACEDFRHGLAYEYAVIGRADPHADEFRIDAVVTAANLYGDTKTSIGVPRNLKHTSVADLIDMSTMRFKQPPDVDGHLKRAISASDFSAFEFDGSRGD
jgi:predicted metal-dependent hydrolase